ncbi:MAG: DUF433 domain-containing protein [Cyanobacteria bacterium 0813]|nr:DUF433 domain-containing protein [Cyanobacteria bacterium 0813]
MMPKSRVVHSDPDILGGTPVFVGTGVPIKTLLDYLEAGDSLDVFLDHFPSVRREQAIAVLELAKGIAFRSPLSITLASIAGCAVAPLPANLDSGQCCRKLMKF